MRRIYKSAKKQQSREQLQNEVMQNMRKLRKQIDPELLARMKALLTEAEPDKKDLPDHIPIDRQRNTQMVMDFLNSPEGAHLKDKILNR